MEDSEKDFEHNKSRNFEKINELNNNIVDKMQAQNFLNSDELKDDLLDSPVENTYKESEEKKTHEFKNPKSENDKIFANQQENGDITVKKEERITESRYEYGLYFFLFVIYYMGSFVLPTLLGVIYLKEVFLDGFVNYGGVRKWNLIPFQDLGDFFIILKDPVVFTIYITSPLVFIILYLFRQFCSACIVKFYYWIFNRIQERHELINATYKHVRDVNIYHTRNFILRIIKWQFSKGLFPWLTTSMFHFIGSNKIGKNVVIEDSFICSEYLEMKDNSYIGQHSIASSNLVEGLYGALTVKKVKIGENSVLGAFNLIPPGMELGDNAQVLPMSGSTKFTKLKSNRNFWGLPAARLSRKRFERFIQLPEDLNQSTQKKEKINI